jgi:hypothetical protein
MLTGSCLCGVVRYEIAGDPALMYYCHCSTCRKANGTSFATNLIVPAADFTVTSGRETLSSYESSPAKRRWFCSVCGSPIYSHAEQTSQIVSVRCGTLDGDPGTRPAVHSWVGDKAPWFEITDALPQKSASFA